MNSKWRDKLYPAIKPYSQKYLQVSKIHRIYFEECGNPKGIPVFFVHGGPGGGIIPLYRRFFDPKFYRIILFDQRGCGKSTPYASLEENTTWDLVEDMEQIRKLLKINQFLLFGGSWGSTLSLAYVTKYPKRVAAMILRGIFLCRPSELQWFYEGGASQIFPELWEEYLQPLSYSERNSVNKIRSYYELLTGKNKKKALAAAKAWSTWEGSTSTLIQDRKQIDHYSEDLFALAFSRIECHYFFHKAFFPTDNFLLEQSRKYKNIPGIIVQGRYDIVCPATSAYELHKKWLKAEFIVVEKAGHSCKEKDILKELVKGTEKMKKIF